MAQRSPGNCFNTLVINNSALHELNATELSRAEELLCFRGAEAYFRACKDKRKIQPERSILFTGANCGRLATFVLENFNSIDGSNILIGVETPDIEANLIECREKHVQFSDRVSRKGNQTLGVVAYKGVGQDDDPVEVSVAVFQSSVRQVISLPVHQQVYVSETEARAEVVDEVKELEVVQEDMSMAADS